MATRIVAAAAVLVAAVVAAAIVAAAVVAVVVMAVALSAEDGMGVRLVPPSQITPDATWLHDQTLSALARRGDRACAGAYRAKASLAVGAPRARAAWASRVSWPRLAPTASARCKLPGSRHARKRGKPMAQVSHVIVEPDSARTWAGRAVGIVESCRSFARPEYLPGQALTHADLVVLRLRFAGGGIVEWDPKVACVSATTTC